MIRQTFIQSLRHTKLLTVQKPCITPLRSIATYKSIPVKKQLTVTTVWDQPINSNPELLDLDKIVPPSLGAAMDIPNYTPKARSDDKSIFESYNAGSNKNEPSLAKLHKCLLSMRRVVKVTKGGKVPKMSALVVVGNGNGAVGYGEGKDAEGARAVMKATNLAVKNMMLVDRYDERTILHDLEHEFKSTKVIMRAAPPGFGIRSNPNVHEVCRCAGINDISAKVYGSRNPINVVKATMQALQKQRVPSELARNRGLNVIDVRRKAADHGFRKNMRT